MGWTETVAPVARVAVNFPSEKSIVVYRKAYPISRVTVAAYSYKMVYLISTMIRK